MAHCLYRFALAYRRGHTARLGLSGLLHSSARSLNQLGTAMSIATLPVPRKTSDYGALLAEVQREHLLDRSGRLYAWRIAIITAMTAAGITAFVWVGDSWWTLLIAAYFAVVFAQLGFLGHDAGHQQIFPSRRNNDRLGLLISNGLIGLSYSWWISKHNRHHRHPNEVGRDPDVDRNVLAWTTEQANAQRGLPGLVARHQGAFFFPLLAFEAINLHVGSVRALIASRKRNTVEVALLMLHVAGSLTLLLLVLSPGRALVFLAVQQGLFGVYLGSSFAPNHKGMRMITAEDSLDFLRRQVLTSRNVAGGRIMATVLGGLNYQIEHHLFPCMPSRNLRRCQPLVKRFCAANGVSYSESGLFDSFGQVLRYLEAVKPTVAA
jgi:fatty acid desaturase